MFRPWRPILAVLIIVAGTTAKAGEGSDGGNAMIGGGSSQGLTNAATRSVVDILSRGGGECGGLPQVYRFDCYRQTYKRAADQISGNPSYSEAFKALVLVERTAETVVKQYRDPAKRPIRRGFSSYQAIKPAAVPKATRQVEKSMKDAETILLRSPASKQSQYAKIAEAVNSNKVLLRAILLSPTKPFRIVLRALDLRIL